MVLVRRVIWGAFGAAAFLGAVFAVGVFMGQDSVRAGAADTEILPSVSGTSPTYTPSVVLVKGGVYSGDSPCLAGNTDPTKKCLYVWAKNVNNTTGASAFEVKGSYNSSLVRMWTIASYSSWLGSTGRSVTCQPPEIIEDTGTGAGFAGAYCNTFQTVPLGPMCGNGHCNGLLAILAFQSRGTAMGSTILNFSESDLVDTPPDPNNALPIPATKRSVNVIVAKCADFTGNGGQPDGAIRVNDILYVVQRYFTPGGDLDGDNQTRVGDILIAVQQYFTNCWQ